ncbi:MAG: hypothetical protein KAS12_02650, partial [Candidatus Aenigmarchaeota archaeon]|nr:hypothetical protein [Candidatus Aenigmarchaeota archaeon]
IFSGTLLLVNNFREIVTVETGTIQLEEVTQNIVNDIHALSLLGVNSQLMLTIPKDIAGETYNIVGAVNNNELIIYTPSGMYVQANTSIRVLGTVSSSHGKLNIQHMGTNIIMRGVTNY